MTAESHEHDYRCNFHCPDVDPRPRPKSRGWWTLSGEDFIEALRRAHAGEDPELVYAEWYANSEVER